MTDVALTDALRAGLSGTIATDVGPRASDLTMRLGRADDLAAAAAVLTGPHAMALATVVATDETATSDGDLKVRYIFEPTGPGVPDRFVTLLVSVDAARAEVPSLTLAIPAANAESALRESVWVGSFSGPDDARYAGNFQELSVAFDASVRDWHWLSAFESDGHDNAWALC